MLFHSHVAWFYNDELPIRNGNIRWKSFGAVLLVAGSTSVNEVANEDGGHSSKEQVAEHEPQKGTADINNTGELLP